MVRVRTIVVDSRQRDIQIYPRANSYVVKLNEELKNVVSLELVYALYPTTGTESYMNLFVDEVDNRGSVVTLDSSEISGAFTQLPLVHPHNEYTPARHYSSLSVFRAPLSRLNRLTLRFTDAFGVLYPVTDHLLRFEAVCEERQRGRESDLVQRSALSDAQIPFAAIPTQIPDNTEGYSTQIRLGDAARLQKVRAVDEQRSAAEIHALQRLSMSLANLATGDKRNKKNP
jgi:hypothetical protein